MEYPEGLNQGFSLSAISFLRQKEIYDLSSWNILFDFILASRFAWLSEWLRRKDLDMINLELDYMQILYNNRKILTSIWS